MGLRIAVYGSLREGIGNSRCIEGAQLLSSEVVSLPYEMIDMGSFPGLIRSSEVNDIRMEIYEVNPLTYRRVEQLEGYPSFYNRELIETSSGPADVYFLDKDRGRDYPRSPRVIKTENVYDWVKHYGSMRNSKFD